MEPFSDDDVDDDSEGDVAQRNDAQDQGDIESERSEDLIMPGGLEDSANHENGSTEAYKWEELSGRKRNRKSSLSDQANGKKRKKTDFSEKKPSIQTGYSVAVFCPSTETNDLFLLAKLTEVELSKPSIDNVLKVLWYCPHDENEKRRFEIYSDSQFVRTETEDTIPIESVACTFSNLTKKRKIPKRGICLIRSGLEDDL